MQAERYQSQAEERKREREHARARKDKLQTLRDIEARAEAENLSSDAKPTTAELQEAQSLREEVRGGGSRLHACGACCAALCAVLCAVLCAALYAALCVRGSFHARSCMRTHACAMQRVGHPRFVALQHCGATAEAAAARTCGWCTQLTGVSCG
jgi:Flp pilus assembly protein TadB